jgi:hypothetical protein
MLFKSLMEERRERRTMVPTLTHTDSAFLITPTHLSLTRTQQLQASHHPTRHLLMATSLYIPHSLRAALLPHTPKPSARRTNIPGNPRLHRVDLTWMCSELELERPSHLLKERVPSRIALPSSHGPESTRENSGAMGRQPSSGSISSDINRL